MVGGKEEALGFGSRAKIGSDSRRCVKSAETAWRRARSSCEQKRGQSPLSLAIDSLPFDLVEEDDCLVHQVAARIQQDAAPSLRCGGLAAPA
jgi:hypothetical protein